MELITEMVIYLSIGFSAGFMSGMFGIGGGSIRTPLLYVAGLPLLSAFGINLLVIPLSSLIGSLSHRKNIHWKFAKYIIIGGALGTVIGAVVTGFITTLALAIIFVVVSVITALGIYFGNAGRTAETMIDALESLEPGELTALDAADQA